MAAQICETCKYRYEECYCSPNSTCKDYEEDRVEAIRVNWREEIVQNVKDCGQSLIDNAEKIVGDYKYPREFTITCYADKKDESPYISVDYSFYPENWVKRHQ